MIKITKELEQQAIEHIKGNGSGYSIGKSRGKNGSGNYVIIVRALKSAHKNGRLGITYNED